ncbi:MAG: hypothetical protein AAF213_06145 [Pseudomonadota bacterium]
MPLLYEGMPLRDVRLDWRTRLVAWWEGFDLEAVNNRQARRTTPVVEDKTSQTRQKDSAFPESQEAPSRAGQDRHGRPLWNPTRLQLAELMWGEGFVEPGADSWIPKLVATLPLNPTSSLADLSAGLGGVAGHAAERYGTYVDAYEQSELLLAEAPSRVQDLPDPKRVQFHAFDLDRFDLGRRHEFCIALNLFYTVADKDQLWQALAAILKDRGQLVFTDFVLAADADIQTGALRAWFRTERLEPHLVPISEIEKGLASAGFDVRTVEDMSAPYRRQTKLGLSRLHDHLTNTDLEAEAKSIVTDEIALLTRRLMALEDGLHVKRVHAILPVSAGPDDGFDRVTRENSGQE